MRDALSIFDRLISFSDKDLTYKNVLEHLNVLDYDYYFKVTDSLLKNDIKQLLNIFNDIIDNGFDGHHFINGLASHLRDLLVSKDESTISLLDKGDSLKTSYIEQSKKCDLKFLLTALNLCNECDVNYKATNNQRLLIELTLMRISSTGYDEDQKNSKSFVVSMNDSKREVFVETIVKDKKEESPMIVDVMTNPTVKLDLGGGAKKSALISINRPLQENQQIVKNNDANLVSRDTDFSESELLKKWKDLIVFTKEKGKSNLSIILGVHQPKILQDFLIEIPLSNSAQAEIISDDKFMILEFLRNQLENEKVDITTKIVEAKKSDIPYTNKDKFKKMLDNNPKLESLRMKLGLDPDY